MSNVVVVGMQWGDEGKGKIVDLICPGFDVVARYQGGHNAGHTVRFADRHFALHLVPSGVLHEGVECILGSGMVVDPEAFLTEVDGLEGEGILVRGRVWISRRAHAILPIHAALDRAREEAMGSGRIGTTARGIGPAYESKAARSGLRLCELAGGDLPERLEVLYRRVEGELGVLGAEPPVGRDELEERCREWAERLAPFLRNTERLLNSWIDEDKSVLFEGAQGTLLDLDHGSYPYVSSSSSTAGGACTGTGVPPTRIDGILGVLKAYTTRVGGGPFVSEVEGEIGDFLRKRGNEFGTTTGRPRRCGWLDLVAARYARMVNGVGSIALTKLDVLDRLEEIQLCVGYRYKGEVHDHVPAEAEALERAEPVYRTVPGWRSETTGILELGRLPAAARRYIETLEEEIGAPVDLVSTGPRREETALAAGGELERLVGARLDAVLEQRGGI